MVKKMLSVPVSESVSAGTLPMLRLVHNRVIVGLLH